MHNSLFIASQGSNIFVTLGALDKLKETVQNIKTWNVCGNASLILFFKVLGYTYEQMTHMLFELKNITNMINSSSLLPEEEGGTIEYMKDWLFQKINENKLFQINVTLKEVYQHTNILPSYILWSRNKGKIINLNALKHPDVTLIDATLASLTALGFYSQYRIKNTIFTNIFSIDCYPYLYVLLQEDSDYLYIANLSDINNKIEINLGPMQQQENEIIKQFCEHNNFRIQNINKILPQNLVSLYSIFQRDELSLEATLGLFKTGNRQGQAFLEGRDTRLEAENYINTINSQS